MPPADKRQAWHHLVMIILATVAGGGGYMTQDAAREVRQEVRELRTLLVDLAQGDALQDWRITQLEKKHGDGGT